MWVVLGTRVTHMVCCHRMRILKSSFAYLFWLANNNQGKYPEFYICIWATVMKLCVWILGSAWCKCYPHGLSSPMLNTVDVCINLFWLANKNKAKYPDLYMGYSDETLYVGRSTLKYYPCVLVLLMCMLITSFAYSFWLADKPNSNFQFYMGLNDELSM